MRIIEILIDLEKQGTLKKLYNTGMVPCKFKTYMEIWFFVDAKKSVGQNMMSIISEAEDKFGVCQTTIYKALKLMNE